MTARQADAYLLFLYDEGFGVFLPPLFPSPWMGCWCIARLLPALLEIVGLLQNSHHLSVSILLLISLSLYYACTKQIEKPKTWKNVESTSRKRAFSIFLKCHQMSEVFYCSVTHGLGFFICFVINFTRCEQKQQSTQIDKLTGRDLLPLKCYTGFVFKTFCCFAQLYHKFLQRKCFSRSLRKMLNRGNLAKNNKTRFFSFT